MNGNDCDQSDTAALIRDALQQLTSLPNQVFELRALNVPARFGKPMTLSGFYNDLDAMASDAAKLDAALTNENGYGIYVTLNPVDPNCLAWANNVLVSRPTHTAGDDHILQRSWIFVDLDPVRLPDVSSTDAELELARDKAVQVARGLLAQYDAAEIVAMSGNGYHLLYRLDPPLPNNPESTKRVEQFLKDLNEKYSDDAVKVDVSVSNAARIIRLYGTWSRKGFDVPSIGRGHRRSYICERGLL